MFKGNMKVSVIVPCYNAADKIGRCLASLRAMDMPRENYEVIFIDDCSSDATFQLLQRECSKEPNWKAERLPINTGSPSKPRNRGMELAKGEYLFFLDCDDEITSDTLRLHHEYATSIDADVVRGSLLVNDGRRLFTMNNLDDWSESLSREERIAYIVKGQSMGSTNLIRATHLSKNNIEWQEDIRMGEDTLFLARALVTASSIGYINHPAITYNKLPSLLASTTQSFGAKELRDHLIMWPSLAELLSKVGINYYEARFKVSLRYILSILIERNRGDVDEELFSKFSSFIISISDIVSKFEYTDRYKDIVTTLLQSDFEEFSRLCRPRLLIAGYDLKFIASALPELNMHFDVRFDEWSDQPEVEEKERRELLNWAEVIWCEWLLNSATWYSNNKKPNQKLVIRMHRYELSRDFGEKLRIENVDAVMAVSVHFFERLLERYPNIPRHKARLIPNFLRTDDYQQNHNDDCLFTLGMIGILPARKRLDRALNILAILRKQDARYRLEIFGKQPEEVRWVATDKQEMAHFEKCRSIIREHKLEDAVTFHGHSDVKKSLAKNNVGFVLSTSDSMREIPGFESFHLAVADGFAAGGVSLIQHWLGAEFIWPKEFIKFSEEEIAESILSFRRDPDAFRRASNRGREFIAEHYGVEKFALSVKNLFSELS
ncbi:glycosyltransferase [Pseudomonas putida]|jgi:glycosyltransferase involved in cell wall biosynthesis